LAETKTLTTEARRHGEKLTRKGMKDPTLIEEENLPPIPTDDTDLKRQTFTAD